ncbi:hypothetical protein [Pseudarthrobacter cellobiosi]|uniref:hypothetical protein n=1 Tax=Pseudarthrobacter cellobiosi TaxID=2953654 RepID=UPI00208E9087|nr:hypothetical protein [Pseudarthrobacter sp. HLT1-5]MCO4257354.1 hypothetical protein [Pseudarthrobacter sp. HLT1-5]
MSTIEELEAQGYIVIPPTDLPEIKTNEDELLAYCDGIDKMALYGSLIKRSVPLPSTSNLGANHSVSNEYRRAVAHLAMAKWYEENLPFEEKVCKLRNEILKGDGMEWWQAKPKRMRTATKQARALLRVQP